MDRDQVLDRIDSAWSDFTNVIDGVPDELFDLTGAVGSWSVKDVIGHVATWDREALDALRQFVEDRNSCSLVTWPDIDDFNAEQREVKRKSELADLRVELEDTHRELVGLLSGLPEEYFESDEVHERIRIDTYEHYEDHGPEIRRWLEGKP